MKDNIAKNKKKVIIVYLILRFLVIVALIIQIFLKNWNNVFLCLLTLLLFLVPSILDRKFNIEIPNTLEIIILLFIYASLILGEISYFYKVFPYWDIILHTINGFICAGIGFSLVDILNQNDKVHMHLSSVFVALVAFCFSMTIGVLWEFYEYGVDNFTNHDMQKDSIVTQIKSVSLNKEGLNEPEKIENIKFSKTNWQTFENNINIALRSLVIILQEFLPIMAKEKYGRIVVMLTSATLNIPPKYLSSYVTTKYALLGLVKALSNEYADKGIRINGVSPSMINTKFLDNIPNLIVEQNALNSPTGKNLSVKDVIPTFKFLLSDNADCITGQNIGITNGNIM